MMRRSLALGARALLLLGLVAWPAALEAQQAPMSNASLTISGTIASIDVRARTMRLKTGPMPVWKEFTVDRQAQITDGQREFALQELVPGTAVQVQYRRAGNQRVAQSVEVIEPMEATSPRPQP